MGRVRPGIVKKIAKRLIAEKEELFTADFEHNKKVLKELGIIPNKKLRNKVAGYMVRVVKNKKF